MSAGKDKRENFERLLREGKLGGLAALRNLRLMLASGVDPKLIRERLDKGVARALPFRFVTAARHAPKLEDALEQAMLKGIAAREKLLGSTGLVADLSGSMNYRLSKKGEITRMDAAAGLASCSARRPKISLSRPSPTHALSFLRAAVRAAGRHCGFAGALGDLPQARTAPPPR